MMILPTRTVTPRWYRDVLPEKVYVAQCWYEMYRLHRRMRPEGRHRLMRFVRMIPPELVVEVTTMAAPITRYFAEAPIDLDRLRLTKAAHVLLAQKEREANVEE
jgi:hypothetical protein